MLLYAVTILVSAFLLFQVQPVIAKIILPWFGGSAAVWTTCLLFFQMVLLLGYLYAHCAVPVPASRAAQAMVHVGLLGRALLAAARHPGRGAGSRPGARTRRCASWCCSPPPSGCRTSCSPPPARCCRPGTRARFTARCRTGCTRSRTPARMLALLSYPVAVRAVAATRSRPSCWSRRIRRVRRCSAAHGAALWRSRRAPADAARATDEDARARGSRSTSLWIALPGLRFASCCSPSPTTSRRTSPPSRSCGFCRSALYLLTLHPVLRGQRLVPPRHLPAAAGGRAGRHGVRPVGDDREHRHQGR